MPNPRNNIKQTGDTRELQAIDELDDDLRDEVDGSGTQPEAAVFHPAASGLPGDGAPGLARSSAGANASDGGSGFGRLAASRAALQDRGRQLGESSRRYVDQAQDQVRAKPLAALGGAFLLGLVLARLTR